jgi:transcriptional regulator with XRE-family HTH domain
MIMAARKTQTAPRNDALSVLTNMFGASAGWDEQIAAATHAAVIAEEVRALRERHGLTQGALATLIGSSQSAIARMEDANYRGHSISVLRRIAAAVEEHVAVRFIAAAATDSAKGNRRQTRLAHATKPGRVGASSSGIPKTGTRTGRGASKSKRVRA